MASAGGNRARRLWVAPALLVALRFASALAPAEPLVLGVPFGLATELLVVVASTISLSLAVSARLSGGRPSSA